MKIFNYKIVCIVQIYNEIEKGNLIRFFKYIKPLVSNIVVYDDCSTDGSYEYSLKHTPYVIRGSKNNFSNEAFNRQDILNLALTLSPEYILWLDADEVLSVDNAKKLQNLCHKMACSGIDGYDFHEINLWRSHSWSRVDSLFDDGWFTRLWKVNKDMRFNLKPGLHQKVIPLTIKNIEKTKDIAVLHYGFANDKSIANKYITYKKHGQRGYIMLDRLINEDNLKLKKVSNSLFPRGLYKLDEKKPIKRSLDCSLSLVEKLKPKLLKPKYSIICLIYKDVNWLEFVYSQVVRYTDLSDCEFFFIANEASNSVKTYLKNNFIPHYLFTDKNRYEGEWYINNVYRAWNYGASKAQGDFLVFINSDMAFTPSWLSKLSGSYNGKNCVSSRLVESGKMPSGKYGVTKFFGSSYSNFNEAEFQDYAKIISISEIKSGGLFMPLLIRKKDFLQVGGYPDGNIKEDSDIYRPKIAKQGEKCISGDVVLMKKLQKIGVEHNTSFSSCVYHFQMGEMSSSSNSKSIVMPSVAICNDLVTGTMEERVLWDYLLELPGTIGIDSRVVGNNKFESKIRKFIEKKQRNVKVIVQNASYMRRIDETKYTIMLLQDNLRAMGRPSEKQELNLKFANKIVTNSIQVIKDYPEFDMEFIPIGVNSTIFKPKNKKLMKLKHNLNYNKIGIFVGSFNKVKGFDEISRIIKSRKDIFWILVTKINEDFYSNNSRVYRRISHDMLSELLNCADFFILGSKVETQCLAAIEAALCNTPVVMHDVGVFQGMSLGDKKQLGYIGNDLVKGINLVLKTSNLKPRSTIIKFSFNIDQMILKWQKVIEEGMIISAKNPAKNSFTSKIISTISRKIAQFKYQTLKDNKFDIGYVGRLIISKTPKNIYELYRRIKYGNL